MSGIRTYNSKILDTVIEAAASEIVDVQSMPGFTFEVDAVVNSTAKVVASASISATTDSFTSAAHGYYTGLKGQFTTSSALPTGLSLATDYYIIVVDANTFQVASSLANALAVPAVPVDLTTVGVGNQTFTPVAISGASYKLQKSNSYDPVTGSGNWIDMVAGETNSAVTNTITATANTMVSGVDCYFAYVRILFAISAGSTSIKVYAAAKAV